MNNSYQKKRALISSYLFDTLPVKNEFSILEFKLSGDFEEKFYAGFGRVINSDGLSIVFSLATFSKNIYFGLTYDDEIKVARVLVNLEDYERENSLNFIGGEIIVIPERNENIKNVRCYAALLLRPESSPVLKKIPDSTEIHSEKINFYLVMPITQDDYKYRNIHGHDALMDLFDIQARDLSFEFEI